MKNKSIVCLALTVQWILMLFKVEVRYSSLVGQILVLNCRHQGLVLLLKFTFTREDLSVNSEDQYFPIDGSIAIHKQNCFDHCRSFNGKSCGTFHEHTL